MEFFSALKDLDAVYVPIGMGSGISAASAVRNGLGLKTKIVGVVSELAPTYARSFEQKECVEALTTTKLADGLACRKPDPTALEVLLANVDHVVTVSETQVGEAMRMFFTDTHNVVEGAGAAARAGALKEKDVLKGKKAGVVATGGNVDHDVFARVLQGKFE